MFDREECFSSFYNRCTVKEESCDHRVASLYGRIFTIGSGSDRVPSDHKQVGIATTCGLLGRQVR